MPWGKKEEELPEALRGKTPEQIDQELKDAKAAATAAGSVDAKIDAAFERFGTSMSEQMDAKLGEFAARLPQPRVENDPNNPPKEPANFITDPDRAFAERSAPLASLTLNTAAMTGRMTYKDILRSRSRTQPGNRDSYLFEKFESEILELAKNVSAAQLANPATWEHLYFNVKGRHTDEITNAIVKDDKTFFGAEAGSGTPPPERVLVDDKTKLTAVESSIAKKFGISEEEYKKQRSNMSELPVMPGVTS